MPTQGDINNANAKAQQVQLHANNLRAEILYFSELRKIGKQGSFDPNDIDPTLFSFTAQDVQDVINVVSSIDDSNQLDILRAFA